MKCAEYRANIGNLFGFGGARATRCKWDATRAVKMGKNSVSTINGWRPVCEICAGMYPGYTVVPIDETDLLDADNAP